MIIEGAKIYFFLNKTANFIYRSFESGSISDASILSLLFYPANSAGEGWMSGGNSVQIGNEITVSIDSGMFKPYFNIQNQSPEAQSYEVTIL